MARKGTRIGRRTLLKGMMGTAAAVPFAGRAAEPRTLDHGWMAPAVRAG